MSQVGPDKDSAKQGRKHVSGHGVANATSSGIKEGTPWDACVRSHGHCKNIPGRRYVPHKHYGYPFFLAAFLDMSMETEMNPPAHRLSLACVF